MLPMGDGELLRPEEVEGAHAATDKTPIASDHDESETATRRRCEQRGWETSTIADSSKGTA
jgi:hypothetical protein